MKINRIAVKLSMIIVSLFFILLLLLGYVVDRIFSNFYYEKAHQEVAELSAHFVKMVQSRQGIPTELISTMAEFSKVEIFVVDTQGQLIGKSSKAPINHLEFIRPNEISGMTNGEGILKEYKDDAGRSYLVCGKPILNQLDHIQGGVIVISSLDIVKASVMKVRQLLCLSGLAGFLIAVGFSSILSRKMSRPLIQMEEATRQIAAGKLETRVETVSKDEIGSLAQAINDLAEDLQRYRDTRNEFFANISHELKTPITYLEGYANVVSQELYETEEEKRKYLDIISEEAKRLNRLIHDLFDLSKMEEGRIPLSPEPVYVNELLDRVMKKVSMKSEAKGLQLIKKMSEPDLLIYGDSNRLEQIFFNLFDNAIRYTQQGNIVISAKQNKGMVCVSVEDSGVGIPPKELPYLFERFYRVEKSRSREHGGSGLGLAIAKKLVEMHDGTIHVFSKYGQGTRFDVCLQKYDLQKSKK
ncbi:MULTISPECIES: ATP-binding protein [unclassified Paenibacillus]|uniref:HAMP domain-containing sensor histidine kinase n=1 Tax=unclassified Paenibacillus TaxID=185978 RepID=UPI001C1265F3|nr:MULTISPECIES: ATP-binding protein [unclassified Paenibacillus]MBU5442909.1 HAMP domain-containing protein [Paenibacillus sp. MSJ-34]CAH0119544.1 Sensor histidine kinase RcsC [Paenibacillus sp. CECT 9249]